MKRSSFFRVALFFLFISAGLSLYVSVCLQSFSYSISSHSFHLDWGLAFSILLIWPLLMGLWRFLSLLETKYAWTSHLRSGGNLLAFLPFTLGFFSPLLLSYYLTQNDLQIRLKILGMVMVLGFLFLTFIHLPDPLRRKISPKKWVHQFNRLPLKKRLWILFLVAFFLYQSSTYFFVSQGKAFMGDEPYYLLTTHSLYQDKDINVANNYRNEDYFHFYPPDLYPNFKLKPYARFGRKGTRSVYSINQPGISVLMLPFYWLSQFFKGKTLIFILKGSLSLWAVLLGLQIYLLSRELWNREKLALSLWIIYSFSCPIFFYAFHLYPEIPIAFFSVYIFRKLRTPKPLSSPQYLFLGFLLSLFLWFGLKYNMIFGPLLLVSGFVFIKEHRIRWRILYFLIFPFLSLILFYLYIYELYGSLYPMAIYEGVITPEKLEAFRKSLFHIPLRLRVDSFLDYFLDQRDGLLLYSPVYFFSFLGLVEAFRRHKRDLCLMLLISLPYILNYAFFTHRQGSCPPGRVLTSVSWVGIILVGYFFAFNRKKLYSVLFGMSVLVSLASSFILLNHPRFLYQPTTHEYTFRAGKFFIHLSNLHFYLPQYLPSFVKVNNLEYLPNYIWLGLILTFIMGYIWKKNLSFPSRFSVRTGLTWAFLLFISWWFVLYPRLSLNFPKKVSFADGEKITFYSLGRYTRMKKPGEFHLTHSPYTYHFHFTSWRKIKKIRLQWEAERGEYKVELKLFDKNLYKGKTSQKLQKFVSFSPPFYPYKNTHLYRISLHLKKLSDTPMPQPPFSFHLYPSYRK
ncbi:hypothetical protein KGY73_01420 [bacterium]|nr:hypothetical protein [bacterium]